MKHKIFISGNTCRSPIVEAVFIDLVKKAGAQRDWEIDSAAIESWHVGNRPNPRAVAVMEKYYLAYDNRARQITTNDFYTFDYILGMGICHSIEMLLSYTSKLNQFF